MQRMFRMRLLGPVENVTVQDSRFDLSGAGSRAVTAGYRVDDPTRTGQHP